MPSARDDQPDLAIDAARRDGLTTISVSGELDIAGADGFATAIRDALAHGDVALDLSALSFMDSAGVFTLNTALREADRHGRALTVRSDMQPMIRQVLELTGMMQLLRFEKDAR